MNIYKNLQVMFTLQTEMIIPQHPIPFDALLMKAMAIKNGYSLDEDPGSFHAPEIPLERHPEFSLYRASIGFVTASGRNAQFYTKQYHGDVPHKVDATGGFFKAYHVRLFTLACPISVQFYCRGEKAAIEELLSYVPALGPKRSQGYGKVHHVKIEEIAEDRSWIYNDQPMRAIPVPFYPEKVNDWYYAPSNPTPPSYTSFQREICYLPPPTAWLTVSGNRFAADEQDQPGKRKTKMKKAKGFRPIWKEGEME